MRRSAPYRCKTSHRRRRTASNATFCSLASPPVRCGVVGPRAARRARVLARRDRRSASTARRLLRIHRGVYAVGHEALSDRGRMIAALLAAGPGAVAHPPDRRASSGSSSPRCRRSSRSRSRTEDAAAAPASSSKTATATAPETTRHESRPGIDHHHPRQTIDATHGPDADRARAEALVPRPHRPLPTTSAEPTRSELDGLASPTLERAGLPRPLVNPAPRTLARSTSIWPDQKLAVEADGWAVPRPSRRVRARPLA